MSIELSLVIGLAALASGAFWRMWALIAEARSVGETAQRDLASHRLHSAETFATKAGLTESLGRVHDALDRLTDRIDALIATQPKPASRRAS